MTLTTWLRPFTVLFLLRSHPLSDQPPGKHMGQGLPYLGFPVSIAIWNAHIPPKPIHTERPSERNRYCL